MGSWNATCGLTNLAITYNTDVYVFPVTEVDTSYYRSHCENNCFYKPQLIPFIATYDDYGYCVNSNGISFKYTVDGLKNYLIEIPKGDRSRDIAVNKETFNEEVFYESAQFNRLKTRFGNVYYSLINKNIADKLFKEYKFDMYVGNLHVDSYLRDITYEQIYDNIVKYIKTYKQQIIANGETSIFSRKTIVIDGVLDEYLEYYITKKAIRYIENSYNSYTNYCSFSDLVYDLLSTDEDETVFSLLHLAMIGVTVDSVMRNVRKIWLPNMFCGSQSQEYDVYLKLNSLIEEHIALKRQDY